MGSFTRILEWIFVLYFVCHIPITLLVDLQILLPASFFPQALKDYNTWYSLTLKDPLATELPPWCVAFVYCEVLAQLPFFPFAVYAFYKGGCKWIRIPAIIYSTHASTCVLLMIAEILFSDFSTFSLGPLSLQERLVLVAVYSPFLLISLLLLNTMLFNPQYRSEEKRKLKAR
ncbi:sigma intracellular receptor 2-like [Microcaecilia unicolor]|uniref:Transmembrane protein 97 n=1 Tax=Microcaecilia unicolor TaxID=1415580 RepID=A0A6P7ZNG2_9AMPH|nr:sigma intracellular receptor 2-like [Microcaecilia unicolor]